MRFSKNLKISVNISYSSSVYTIIKSFPCEKDVQNFRNFYRCLKTFLGWYETTTIIQMHFRVSVYAFCYMQDLILGEIAVKLFSFAVSSPFHIFLTNHLLTYSSFLFIAFFIFVSIFISWTWTCCMCYILLLHERLLLSYIPLHAGRSLPIANSHSASSHSQKSPVPTNVIWNH